MLHVFWSNAKILHQYHSYEKVYCRWVGNNAVARGTFAWIVFNIAYKNYNINSAKATNRSFFNTYNPKNNNCGVPSLPPLFFAIIIFALSWKDGKIVSQVGRKRLTNWTIYKIIQQLLILDHLLTDFNYLPAIADRRQWVSRLVN